MRRASISIALLCLFLAHPRLVRADKISMQARQLRNPATAYKLRLSAALSLARTRDRRAVSAMIYALGNDRRGTVRRVAALSLTKMIDESIPPKLREQALAALRRATRDGDKRVARSASRALSQLSAFTAQASPRVFIRVPPPNDLSRRASADARKSMHLAVKRAIRKHAPRYAQEWPSGKLPTRAQLRQARTRAYWVGATVSRVRVRRVGGRAEIICTVAVRINPWSGADGNERISGKKSAAARGSGKVVSSNTASAIDGATRECLSAVVEEITTRQVVPFLKRLARR